jgi:acetylornithine deacetylase/succinyl-diaminopimelate desuccinylase-like protein
MRARHATRSAIFRACQTSSHSHQNCSHSNPPPAANATPVDFVARWLISRGWNVTLQEVEPHRSNVWATRRGGGVTFSTHLDTGAAVRRTAARRRSTVRPWRE